MSRRRYIAESSMIKAGQLSFSICLAVQGILQLYYGYFRPGLLPAWPSQIPGAAISARLVGVTLVAAALAIVADRKGREVALIVAGVFLAATLVCQVPYAVLVNPRSVNPFSWGGPFNALIMAGCSFVVADSYSGLTPANAPQAPPMRLLQRMIPYGRILFSITILRFGIGHFLHTVHDAALIPAWVPRRVFWTYFTGIALVGSSIAVMAKFKLRLISLLQATMFFLWVVMLHIPRAIADPRSGHGNEIEAAAHALADGGTALLIAVLAHKLPSAKAS